MTLYAYLGLNIVEIHKLLWMWNIVFWQISGEIQVWELQVYDGSTKFDNCGHLKWLLESVSALEAERSIFQKSQVAII